jgi:hypothetical protein
LNRCLRFTPGVVRVTAAVGVEPPVREFVPSVSARTGWPASAVLYVTVTGVPGSGPPPVVMFPDSCVIVDSAVDTFAAEALNAIVPDVPVEIAPVVASRYV